ncbi:hypothetical protein G6M87_10470 [Rhizobium rhizogenes]|uniref:hypothetical protein n=1 Tax=Rhizobium rhizogenes TaxID=359 RepID=UPI0015734B6D|nr:hypothetical protein [Rhizobium rhizogenes]NTI22280.1 hypothetical protein [Rhizobium rhizogenes]QTG05870.1 hypothetical protein G6M87_10470 [Rhizobium rhizogenes]
MGWLSNKLGNWATATQKKELTEFVDRLRAMDGSEIGLVVAIGTDRRHKLKEVLGWDMLEPALLERSEPFAAMQLNKLIRQMQVDKKPLVAAGLLIWIHTLRAANSLDLRQQGREMWRQLERGFPHAYASAEGFYDLGGPELNLDNYQIFPSGLTPDPL